MKKLFLFISLFTIVATTRAQFPSTDSLRAWNNKYNINALTAYQQLRNQTMINGIIDWIDIARLGTSGSVGVDTLYFPNDTTLRYKKNGVFYNKYFKGKYDYEVKQKNTEMLNDSAMKITYNHNGADYFDTIIIRGIGGNGPPVDGTETKVTGTGDILVTGVGSVASPYLIEYVGSGGGSDSSFQTITLAGLNALSGANTTKPYYITDLYKEGFWYYAGTVADQSSENMATVIVTPDLKQYKRQYNGVLNLAWFPGASPDYVYPNTGTDNTAALNLMYAAAVAGQKMYIPKIGTGWRFATTPNTWTNSKLMYLVIDGNTYHNGTTFIKVLNSGLLHRFVHNGYFIGNDNLPSHTYAGYTAIPQTGLDAPTGVNWESLTGSAIELQDSHKGDYKVNFIEGFAYGFRLLGGVDGQDGGQENTFDFKLLKRNRVGILLQSIDGTSYVDKQYFHGGRLSGDTAIKFDGNMTVANYTDSGNTGAFRHNVFENVLIEACNTGIVIEGDASFNTFLGCSIEGGAQTGVYGPTKIWISNGTSTVYPTPPYAAGSTDRPRDNSFVACEFMQADWFSHGFVGKNTNWSSSTMVGSGGATLGNFGIGGATGRMTTLGGEPLGFSARTYTPDYLDLITLGGGIQGEPRSTIFAYAKINGIERRVGYKGAYTHFYTEQTNDTLDLPVNVGYVKMFQNENKSMRIDTGDIKNGESFYFDLKTGGYTNQFLNKNTGSVLIPSSAFTSGAGLYKATYTDEGYRVFKIDGSGSGVATDKLQALSLADYGGIEGSSTTASRNANVTAWNNMIAAAANEQLVVIPKGVWYFNDTLVASSTTKHFNIWVIGKTFYSNGGIEISGGAFHKIKVDGEMVGSGTGATDSLSYSAYIGNGLYIKNTSNVDVDVNRIVGFNTGIKLAGESTTTFKGAQYINVKYGIICKNYIQIHLTTVGATSGVPPADKGNWCNGNTFWGGQIGSGLTGPGGGTFGILVKRTAGSDQEDPFNGNMFYNTGIEGVQYGIYMEKANFNSFIGGRWEAGAVTNKIYLSQDNTAPASIDRIECYGNSFTGMTPFYQSYFMPSGFGYGTKVDKILTPSGVFIADIAFASGTASNLIGIVGDESTTAFTEATIDAIALGGFNGNGNYYRGFRLKRAGLIDGWIPLEGNTTLVTSSYSLGSDIQFVMVNPITTATITLPAPASWPSRQVTIKSLATWEPDQPSTVTVDGLTRPGDPNVIPGGASVTYRSMSISGTYYWVAIDVARDINASGGTGGSGGDVSSSITTSTDNQLVLFNGTTGKLIKGSTGTGVVTVTSGVVSTVTKVHLNTQVDNILPFANGGTGLSTLGTALQAIRVNAAGTALEYYTPSGGGGGGITTMAAVGTTPNPNGATISGSTLQLQIANAVAGVPVAGLMGTGAQTFGGAKTFTGSLTLRNNTASAGTQPLMFGTGSSYLLTSVAVNGALEFDGLNLYFTSGNTRQIILTNSNIVGSVTGKTIAVTSGGTGLTTIGTAGQSLRVNAGGTGLEYYTPSGGGGSDLYTSNGTLTSNRTITGGSGIGLTFNTLSGFNVNNAGSINLTAGGPVTIGSSASVIDIDGAVTRSYADVTTSTLTLDEKKHMYFYRGGTGTWTLNNRPGWAGLVFIIKNAGSGNLTIQRTGTDLIYDTSAVTSIVIAPGGSKMICAGDFYWYVIN